METSAIIFNREHKMDFNKWIYQGIPYMSAKYEKSLIDTVKESNINVYNSDKVKPSSLYREEDKQKYEEFQKQFCEYYASVAKDHVWEKYPKYFVYHILNQLQPEIRKEIYFRYDEFLG
jgi:hypothetical protein